MRRRGARGAGDWEEIGWDAALDAVADGLMEVRAAHGPLSLIGAVSSAFFSRGAMVALLMRALGSPNWMMNQDLCGGCRALSDRITGLACVGGEDVDRTKCALVVGRNPSPPTRRSGGPSNAPRRGARRSSSSTRRAPRRRRWPICGCGPARRRRSAGPGHAARDPRRGPPRPRFVARWCHGFDALARHVAPFHARMGCRAERRPRRRRRARGAALRRRPVGLRQRARDRRLLQRRPDLSRLPRSGRGHRQSRPAGRQFAGQAAARLPQLYRDAPRPGVPPRAGGRGADDRRGPVPALGGAGRLANPPATTLRRSRRS